MNNEIIEELYNNFVTETEHRDLEETGEAIRLFSESGATEDIKDKGMMLAMLCEKQGFIYGFKMAARLMKEVYTN